MHLQYGPSVEPRVQGSVKLRLAYAEEHKTMLQFEPLREGKPSKRKSRVS